MSTRELSLRIAVLLASLIFVIACATAPATPTLVPPTETSSPIPPTATIAPTSTPVPVPTETSRPEGAIVEITSQAMDVVSSWNGGIVAFTAATDPIANLDGLTANDVGFWNNSRLGFDLYKAVTSLLSADLGAQWGDGIYGCPQVNEAFSSCGLRLYFTDDSVSEVTGGVKVTFQTKP